MANSVDTSDEGETADLDSLIKQTNSAHKDEIFKIFDQIPKDKTTLLAQQPKQDGTVTKAAPSTLVEVLAR